MDQKIIDAALEESQIHALRFTMEDLTRRLHVSKSSLYKMVPSKNALIQGIINYKISEFYKRKSKIITSPGTTDEKLMGLLHIYTDIFGFMGSRIAGDLKSLYPDQWKKWQDFQRNNVETVLELIRQGIEKGVYNSFRLSFLEEYLTASVAAASDPATLTRSGLSHREAMEELSRLFLYGLKKNNGKA